VAEGQGTDPVSPREAEVLDALARHLTNAEIAEELFISVRTVESHVSSLLRKLHAEDRRALAARAADRRLPRPRPTVGLPAPIVDLAGRGAFIGRDDELDALVRLAADVAARPRRHLALIVGEAGIGKSRLAAEVTVVLEGRTPAIGFGRCDAEAALPYQPFAEVLDHLLPAAPAEVREAAAPSLQELVPTWVLPEAAAPVPSDPAAARQQLLRAVDQVLGALPQPVLLVVDDLHWADRSSITLLRHLLRSHREGSLLVLATVRPEGLAPEAPLAGVLTDLTPDGAVSRRDLDGLSADEVGRLAAVEYPSAVDAATDAWERAGGNVFLTRELLSHLAATGSGAGEVPPGLRELVAGRIARLEPRLIQVLTAGALAGESFRLGPTARAAGEQPAELLGAVDAAVLAGLVRELPGRDDEYRFSHALVRDALVQRIGSTRRLHLHLRLAEELEHVADDRVAVRIAHHRLEALPEGDPQAAAAAAGRAADLVLAAFAYEEAAALRQAAAGALAGAGDGLGEAEQRLARADALCRAGETAAGRAELEQVVTAARRHQAPVLLARAALALGQVGAVWGADERLVSLLEEALGSLDDDELALRSQLRARLALALYYEASPAVRAALAIDAEQEAMASGSSEALARVLVARHDAEWGPEGVEDRIETAGKIVALGAQLEHVELQLRGCGLLVADRLEQGDAAGAREAALRHAELAARLRQPSHEQDAFAWQVTWALMEGRIEDARTGMEDLRAFGEQLELPATDDLYWIQRYGLAIEWDDQEEVDEVVAAYAERAEARPLVPAWWGALAALQVRQGDHDGARRHLDRLAADGFAAIPRDVVWQTALTYLADVSAHLGDAERSAVLLDELAPFADRVVVVDRGMLCKGSIALNLGVLATVCERWEDARRWLRMAEARHQQMGAGPLLDRTREALSALPG
jgi:DNA-binding CsgD family transcriptional regulator